MKKLSQKQIITLVVRAKAGEEIIIYAIVDILSGPSSHPTLTMVKLTKETTVTADKYYFGIGPYIEKWLDGTNYISKVSRFNWDREEWFSNYWHAYARYQQLAQKGQSNEAQ